MDIRAASLKIYEKIVTSDDPRRSFEQLCQAPHDRSSVAAGEYHDLFAKLRKHGGEELSTKFRTHLVGNYRSYSDKLGQKNSYAYIPELLNLCHEITEHSLDRSRWVGVVQSLMNWKRFCLEALGQTITIDEQKLQEEAYQLINLCQGEGSALVREEKLHRAMSSSFFADLLGHYEPEDDGKIAAWWEANIISHLKKSGEWLVTDPNNRAVLIKLSLMTTPQKKRREIYEKSEGIFQRLRAIIYQPCNSDESRRSANLGEIIVSRKNELCPLIQGGVSLKGLPKDEVDRFIADLAVEKLPRGAAEKLYSHWVKANYLTNGDQGKIAAQELKERVFLLWHQRG